MIWAAFNRASQEPLTFLMTVSEARMYAHRSGTTRLEFDAGEPGAGGVTFGEDDLGGHLIVGFTFDDPVDVVGGDGQEVRHVRAVLGAVLVGDTQGDVVVDTSPRLNVWVGVEDFSEAELGGVRVEADGFIDRTRPSLVGLVANEVA